MIKVLIADDHTIVREGLKQILSEPSDIVVVDEAKDGQEVLSKVWEKDFDVVVLDITMPGQSGLEVLKQIRTVKPNLNVLILSMHPEDQYAIRVLKAGASGYVTKDTASDELINAIRKVSQGRKYVSSSLAEKLAFGVSSGIETEKPLHDSLSDREYEVMCKIASGKAVNRIAQELSLSAKTISTYRARIMDKMNMKTNADLIHYAIQNRLIE